MTKMQQFTVGDVIRMEHYATCGGYRCWKIVGMHLGGEKQEGTYELEPLDVYGNELIHVPCLMLESHPGIYRV
jgi:hypothetical protein